ncbi:MAG: glycosyltransferase family A protein [Gammaproteobacteria bacterium]
MEDSVAVIVPTFNRSAVLPRALDSVLAQTIQPEQICVVDDGSTDDTAALIARHYPQLTYLVQGNAGVSAARNLGVRNTNARWLAFLDSDDEWLPQKLEIQLQAASDHPDTRLVHCDEIWIRNGRRVNPMNKHKKSGGDIFGQCLNLCAISPSAAVLRRDLFDQMGGFDPEFPACEDYDLWLRVCARYPVTYIDTPLLKKYGGHEDQLSKKYWGLDRFRVRALAKLLDSGVLQSKPEKHRQTLTVLHEKCGILMMGARKRGNQDLLEECQTLLDKFGIASTGSDHAAAS